MRRRLSGLLLFALLEGAAQAQSLPAPTTTDTVPEHDENSGQDPTRPVTRVDLRLKFQNNPNGFDTQIFTLRADKPFVLGGGWKLSTRADLPLVRTDTITPHNLDGDFKTGVGAGLLMTAAAQACVINQKGKPLLEKAPLQTMKVSGLELL